MKKYLIPLFVASILLICVGAGKKNMTLFMVGDSTMADKVELDANPERGWGQLFPTFLNEGIVIENHAMNGRSTKSFRDQGRWDTVMARVSKGDIVIIQFGHNDTKKDDPARYASVDDYEKNLMAMIADAQKKKANVILCTPISRRYFKEGTFYPRHGAYPEAARRVAQRMNVPMLDLEKSTREWIENMGDEASTAYFMNVAPGECTKYPEGRTDNTHLRENGALEVGRMAAQMIVDMKIKPLYKYINLQARDVKYTTPCGVREF